MSSNTINPSVNRSKISATALLLLCASGCFAEAGEREYGTTAEALTEYSAPAGANRAFVGVSNSDVWIGYESGLTGDGTCLGWTQIGSAPLIGQPPKLWDRTRLHMTSGADEVLIWSAGGSFTKCGKTLTAIPQDAKLEIYTWAGNDKVFSAAATGNLQVLGGDGNDGIIVGAAYLVSGEAGSDDMITVAVGPFDTTVVGGSANDTICAYGQNYQHGGGSGTDAQWLGGAAPSGGYLDAIEVATDMADCVAKRTAITNGIID